MLSTARSKRKLHLLLLEMQNGIVTWKETLAFFLCVKLNVCLPYNPAIMLFGIYPDELKIYVHTKPFTQLFIAILFIVSKA